MSVRLTFGQKYQLAILILVRKAQKGCYKKKEKACDRNKSQIKLIQKQLVAREIARKVRVRRNVKANKCQDKCHVFPKILANKKGYRYYRKKKIVLQKTSLRIR